MKRKQREPRVVVLLEDVVAEMDVPNDSWTAYLNRRTGAFITATDEDGTLLEGQDPEDLLGQDGAGPVDVEEALSSGDWLELPTKFDIHEYLLLERFSLGVEDAGVRAELLQAIRGRGAFRRFKEVIHEHGIAEAWYAYRQECLEAIAVEWLEANGIAYVRKNGSRENEGE